MKCCTVKLNMLIYLMLIYAVIGVYMATILPFNAMGASIEQEYKCPSGERILLYKNKTLTPDEAIQFCASKKGTLLNLGSTGIQSYFSSCGLTLPQRGSFYVSQCTTVRMDNGRFTQKDVVDCNAVKASPICKIPANTYRLCDKKDDWVQYKNYDYCMCNKPLSHTEASFHCFKMNSSLADFYITADRVLLALLGNEQQYSLNGDHEFWATVIGSGKNCVLGCYVVIQLHDVLEAFQDNQSPQKSRIFLCGKSSPTVTSSSPIISSVVPTATSSNPNNIVLTTWTSSTMSPITTVRSKNLTTVENGPTWTTIGQSEYILVKKGLDYVTAFENCQNTYDASLIVFLDPISYFRVFSDLHITDDTYWIVAQANRTTSSVNRCVAFHGVNRTMSMLPCEDKQFSVCKRSIYGNDTDQPLLHPQFIQLLKEMTVDKTETVVNKRKLVSAEDRRTSAKTTGSLGIVILSVLVSVMVLMDLSHLKGRFSK